MSNLLFVTKSYNKPQKIHSHDNIFVYEKWFKRLYNNYPQDSIKIIEIITTRELRDQVKIISS